MSYQWTHTSVVWTRGKERREAASDGHIPQTVVVWTREKERREAASVIPMDTYLMRRRLQWYGHVGRRGERQRVSYLWTHTS